MLTSVGSQSSDAKISFLTVPGLMTPGQRMSIGARMPPSQVLSLPPLNGVVPPSGKVMVSAPLSVVNTTMVLLSWPMSSSFFSTYADVVIHLLHAGFVEAPVLAAGLADHGLVLVIQHGRDVHARRVVPGEERLVGLLRIVAIEEVDDLGRDFLVDTLRSLERQRSLVVALLSFGSAVGDVHDSTGRGGVRQTVVFGSTAPGTSARPGIGVFLHGGATVCWVGDLLMSGKLTPCIASR